MMGWQWWKWSVNRRQRKLLHFPQVYPGTGPGSERTNKAEVRIVMFSDTRLLGSRCRLQTIESRALIFLPFRPPDPTSNSLTTRLTAIRIPSTAFPKLLLKGRGNPLAKKVLRKPPGTPVTISVTIEDREVGAATEPVRRPDKNHVLFKPWDGDIPRPPSPACHSRS